MACENIQTFKEGLTPFFHLPYPNQPAGGNFSATTSIKVRFNEIKLQILMILEAHDKPTAQLHGT
jgi:hypothetical protein